MRKTVRFLSAQDKKHKSVEDRIKQGNGSCKIELCCTAEHDTKKRRMTNAVLNQRILRDGTSLHRTTCCDNDLLPSKGLRLMPHLV